jgi:glycerate 2-kinase
MTVYQMSKSQARAGLMRIFAAAVAAVGPRRVVANAFDGILPDSAGIAEMCDSARRVYLLAVGKAAPGMAAEAGRRIGAKLHDALVIAPRPVDEQQAGSRDNGFRVIAAAHPTPDDSSESAGRAALQFVAIPQTDDLVVFLLSGGASSLMVVPAEGLTLHNKVAATYALMSAGASIRELNTVRKHLSAIKGGRLLQAANSKFLSLILSDVAANDLSTIGSGPTAPDPTTYSDAISILKRRGVWGRAPESIRDHLERGAAGEVAETLKTGDSALERACNRIVADNGIAVEAACATAAESGYNVYRYRDLTGEADQAGAALGSFLNGLAGERCCVIACGEMVVSVKGNGKGGRAQQAALAMAIELAKLGTNRRIAALFAGTDGIDGPTDAAGAIVTTNTLARASEAGLDPGSALGRNDAYNFFKALGDLVITGPTGTNVADIFIGLVDY